MKKSYFAWGLAAAVLIFGPVTWRMLAWERTQPQTIDDAQAKAGAVLFSHEWQPKDPLCGGGDGLGPVFNARSCVACHNQGGVGGGGGLDHNVTVFVLQSRDGRSLPREGVIHADAISPKYRETLNHLDPRLPSISKVALDQIVRPNLNGKDMAPKAGALALPDHIQLSQRNTPALFGAKLIDEIPDRVIIAQERAQQLQFAMASSNTESHPIGRAHRLPSAQIGRFGWKGQTGRLADFVQAACANELGLGNPTQAQPVSLASPGYKASGIDLTQAQCDEITAFVAALPKPVERAPADPAHQTDVTAGKALFSKIGCIQCHVQNLGSVEGIYSDLLLHRMGQTLEGTGTSYGGPPVPSSPSVPSPGPLADEWRTPPLWGVADSAPYLHDGRAATLEDAIEMHAGQALAAATRFRALNNQERIQLTTFLRTLKAP